MSLINRFLRKPSVYIAYPLCTLASLGFNVLWSSLLGKQISPCNIFSRVKEYQSKASVLDFCISGPIGEEFVFSSGYTTSHMDEDTILKCKRFSLCLIFAQLLHGRFSVAVCLSAFMSYRYNKSILSKFISGLLFGICHIPNTPTLIEIVSTVLLYAPIHWLKLYFSGLIRKKYNPRHGFFYTFFEHISINTCAAVLR